jgi:hypothetical protein
MNELESRLRGLAAEVDYPATPPIAAAVVGRLGEEPGGSTVRGRQTADRAGRAHPGPQDEAGFDRWQRRPGRRAWRRLTTRTAVLAAALVLLAAGVVAAAVPSVRDSVLRLVGLRGVTIERVPALPADVQRHLGRVLGTPTTLAAAGDSLSFTPLAPSGLGRPNGVFVGRRDDPRGDAPPGGELTLTYAPRPGLPRSRYTGVGLLVNEIDGRLAPGTFGKLMPPSSRADRFRIDGELALWIEGLHGIYRQLHGYYYKDTEHNFRIGRVRLTGNALLLQQGPVLVRLEGEFPLPKAIALAHSLHPG